MNNWQHELKQSITSVTALCKQLSLPTAMFDTNTLTFPIRAPISFIKRIEVGNPQDPLLQQIIAQSDERLETPGFTLDPLDEHDSILPGLLHKYPGRVLVTLAGACAINCRYCFRRHFPYTANQALAHWPKVMDYLKNDASIHEVILSGGDPLMVDDHRLQALIDSLETIDSIKTLRIHTRLPVVIPSRITTQFCQTLKNTRLNSVVVLHINHANEIDTLLENQLKHLKQSTTLLNQAVLLKNVNDSLDALSNLSYRLWDAGVLPYYLHQLDRVSGVAHFEVDILTGKKLIADMRASLPGYLVPNYAKEMPGESSKQLL